jgi:hypothetical protein
MRNIWGPNPEPPWLDDDHFHNCPAHEDNRSGACRCEEIDQQRREDAAERRADRY